MLRGEGTEGFRNRCLDCMKAFDNKHSKIYLVESGCIAKIDLLRAIMIIVSKRRGQLRVPGTV